MTRPKILLINPNCMLPPIAPIGLEYIAFALIRNGYEPVLCDLTFSLDWRRELTKTISDIKPTAIGVTIRNVDDAYFASQDFILKKTTSIIQYIMELSSAPVILGGIGFSMAPEAILKFTGATYGIAGDGEVALPQLLDCIAANEEVSKVSGAVFWTDDNETVLTTPCLTSVADMPVPPRNFLDNSRYFNEGGQAGIETKRGCNQKCIYCMEPKAKGHIVRLRSPESVVNEFIDLLEQDINVFHLCDSEFNIPDEHAQVVCEEIIKRGIAKKLKWYVYASPLSFNKELAGIMAQAGCMGVNFGVDHGDEQMLKKLGRQHSVEDIKCSAESCRHAGLRVMFDTLLGSPGETKHSIAKTINLMRQVAPDRVGLSCGVRVYPNTPLANYVRQNGPLNANPNLYGATKDNDSLLKPVFFVDSNLGNEIHSYVSSLIGDDKIFLHADPGELEGNYNYNDNSVLAYAIRNGERGAYWDILLRIQEDGLQ